MGSRDSLTEALKRLCEREGGHAAVAEVAGVSADNLWQILAGVKLPSGRPRGVGPQVARKLDAAFPGWANPPPAAPAPGPADVSKALWLVARLVADLPRLDRLQVATLLPLLAQEPETRVETCKAIMERIGTADVVIEPFSELAQDLAQKLDAIPEEGRIRAHRAASHALSLQMIGQPADTIATPQQPPAPRPGPAIRKPR